MKHMTIANPTLLVILLLLVLSGVAAMVLAAGCKPKGEEGDWARMTKKLGPPGKRLKSPDHVFPSGSAEEAFEQIDAIRRFARAYPRSSRIDEIIEGYLFPNLDQDLDNGIRTHDTKTEEWDNQFLSLLAWELHTLAPERRPGFLGTLEARLRELHRAGPVLELLAEKIGDERLGSRAKAKTGEDMAAATLARRSAFLVAQGEKAADLSDTQRKMRKLLEGFKGAEDCYMLDLRWPERVAGLDDAVRSRFLGWVRGELAKIVGLSWTHPGSDPCKGKVRARLLLELQSKVEKLPVVVIRPQQVVTRTDKVLSAKYSHGRGRFEHAWVDRKTTETRGGGASQQTYPLLRLRYSLSGPDGPPLATGTVGSDWTLQDIPGASAHGTEPKPTKRLYRITPGSEVANDTLAYSAENLSFRMVQELLGEWFR